MKKYVVVSLLAMSLLACASETVPAKENSLQAHTAQNQTQRSKQTASPYQEVFAKVAPILEVDAGNVQPYEMFHSVKKNGKFQEIVLSLTMIERDAISSSELDGVNAAVTQAMEDMGWTLDGDSMADGEDGYQRIFYKNGDMCVFNGSYNEQATGVSQVDAYSRDDLEWMYSARVACGKKP